MVEAFRLLIGSVGDDSHSVGMALLEVAFREADFFVENIGIMNNLEDFFHRAEEFDAVLISCMNGHVDLYLHDFPYRLKRFAQKNGAAKLWYLGGNLSVQDGGETVVRKYRRMGFDFVSPKPIAVENVIKQLLKDFRGKGIKKKRVGRLVPAGEVVIPGVDTVTDDPMGDTEFFSTREAVLDSWPTGAGVREAPVRQNHSLAGRNFHQVILDRRARGGLPLVQPRTGVAHTDDEIEILAFLRERGLDIASIQLDAASRKNKYDKAREGVLKTGKGETSFLNGYPVPVHGVEGVERILRAIDTPFQVRAGSPDHRLVYEIGLAGGTGSLEGGFLCYLYPYDKNTPPTRSLFYWKYVDRLVDFYYQRFGIIVNREYFGPLTCCLIEPTIPICINIVQALLSARWGARCISVGLAEQGNRSQDIAAIRVLDKLTRAYLAKYGFSDRTVSTVFHQYMAAFPTDVLKASDLIVQSSVTAALAGADRVMTKTPVESAHIPFKEDNAAGLALTHRGLAMAAETEPDQGRVRMEMGLLEKQVHGIMGMIETLGRGSMARGAMRAFEKGILDIPFSPSIYNCNRLITARDRGGAVRFVNPETLPFDEAVRDFHKEAIHRRMVAERTQKVYEILEKDLTRIWKNDFKRWPLDDVYIS